MIYVYHLLLAFSWAMLLLSFIKSMQYGGKIDSKVFGILSFIAMIAVLIVGTKMILLNHSITKTGNWLHVKLTLDVILMIENLFLLNLVRLKKQLSSKCGNILYIFTFLSFLSMIFLTLAKPF